MSDHGTLVVTSDQGFWDDKQVAALSQLGLSRASKGDLQVFLHTCQRTGLDPFARQIYMIERGGRYTIQSSIDGLRIVAQRSNNYGGQTPAEWCGDDGKWVDIWLAKTPPVAARIGVYYKDTPNPTYAVAKWDSYAGTSPIWKKMPDLMLSKCAEALALRKAFPQDLSGIYTSDEMAQADVEKPESTQPKATAPAKILEAVVVEEVSEEDQAYTSTLVTQVGQINDLAELRKLWTDEAPFLDVAINGSTLKDVINARAKELQV